MDQVFCEFFRMLCKVYSLTFEFLRANDQESLVYVKKNIRKENILPWQNTTPVSWKGFFICIAQTIKIVTLLQWMKLFFTFSGLLNSQKLFFKIDNYWVIQLKGYI